MNLNIKQLRKERKVSQESLAELLEVTSQAFSRYERGERELGYKALAKLAKFFDVSIDYLLGNSEYYYPDALATNEERELLAMFGEMTTAQKVRFIAYGEGMLGRSATEKQA